jgi:hypothetical protein
VEVGPCPLANGQYISAAGNSNFFQLLTAANMNFADVHDLCHEFYGQSGLVRGICIWYTGRPRNYPSPLDHASKLTVT